MNVYEIKVIKENNTLGYEPSTQLVPTRVTVNNKEVEYGLTKGLAGSIIKFKRGLNEGDLLKVEFHSDLPKVFTKNKYGKGSLYKLYNDEVKFKLNSKYKFVLEAAHETYDLEFGSKYDPFFTTIKTIRRDTGTLLDNVSDEVIASLIYDNSLYAMDKLINIDDGETVTDLYGLDEFEYRVPAYVKGYVRYKTDIDLCYSIYLSKAGKLGSFAKKLGDLDVSNEIKLPDLEKMLSRFNKLLKPYEDLLNGEEGGDTTVAFVKASTTAYTVANRGVF